MAKIFKKLRSKGKLTEKDVNFALRDIKLTLLESDVNYDVVRDFVDSVARRAVGVDVLESLTPGQQFIKVVKDELVDLLGGVDVVNAFSFPSKGSLVVMMCGLQGSGKTTHCGKIAKYYLKQGRRPLLVACDVYRPAAIKQLEVVGADVGVKVFEMGNVSPVDIASEALKYAADYGHDLVILDTAGRLHVDDELMDELLNLKSAVSVNETLFVLDAMMGQDALNVAKTFNERVGFDGVVLTKLDGDTKGGAALSVLYTTGKPIKFVGVGEKADDIELFKPDGMASRILGMGDVLSLIEKAKSAVELKDVEKMTEKLKKNKFDMEDLLVQMKQIKRLGSIKSIIGSIPGVAGKIKDEDLEKGEDKIAKVEAIICSMTKSERSTPSIIDYSRRRRISSGSGTTLSDVNQLLKQFDQMQKLFKKFGGKKGRFKNMLFPKFR